MVQATNAGDVRVVTSATESKYNLPKDLLYKMAGMESNYNAGALSPKGAQGWFQFMPATAKEYGLTDPANLEASSDAAGRKMRDLLAKHSGNVDYALVDYNGGGKAVKALQAGSPWNESSGYLQKYHGKTADEIVAPYRSGAVVSTSQPMGAAFTSMTSTPPVDGPSASQLVYDQRKRDNKFGGVTGFVSNLPRAAALGFETQNSVWNYFQDKGVEQADGTPLDWQSKEAQEKLGQYPKNHWDYLLQSGTQEEFSKRSVRLQDTMDKERELGNMGLGLALTGGIMGGLPDLPTLIGALPFVGGAGLMTKAGRMSNALKMAAMGGATNVAYDAVANQYKPTATTDDLYISALMGMGMGALGGAIANPKRFALREENLALSEYGMTKGAGAMRREVEANLPASKVSPLDGSPDTRTAALKGHDAWASSLGRPPAEKPKVAILNGGPEDIPTATKAGPLDEPKATPRETRLAPPEAAATVNPNGKPWGVEWDTPKRIERVGGSETLQLPPLKKISELADYVRQYSTIPSNVAVLNRALKSLDLRKLKFDIVEPGLAPSKMVDGKLVRQMEKSYGVVSTPFNSSGDGIEMALRGHGWGAKMTGLNEETFVHEVLHAATVYKWMRVESGNTAGMHADTVKAYRELNTLYATVKEMSVFPDLLPPKFQAAMQNAREFISYGLTNPEMQAYLRTVEVAGSRTTLWDAFTNSLRKMLGMTKDEGNAYARLIDLTSGMLDKSGVEGTPRVRTNFEAPGSYIDPEDVAAANKADLPAVYGFGLGLEHKLGGAAVPAPVRELASKLFGTTVGYKGNAVVGRNAWDDTIAKAEGWVAETRKTGYAAFDEWKKTSGHPWYDKAKAFEQFGEEVSNFVRGFPGDHHPEVVKAGKQIQEINARIVKEINNPAHTDGGLKRGLTEIEVLDKATGLKVMQGKLEENTNYLARKHDAQKWDSMVRTWGRERVEDWWAGAYAKVHPERSAEDSKKWAGWYMRTVEEAHMNRSADHLEEMMSGFDERALKESLMRNGGYTETEAWSVIKGMFQKPNSDAGRTGASLRHRNHISEAHSETWLNAAGEKVEVNLNDFIRSNAFDVQESYYRRMASSISLANRLDIYKQSDIGRLIDGATNKGFGSSVSDASAAKHKEHLKFAFERVQGIPQEEWSAVNKGFEMWRDFNVIRLMGGAVWNQATELAQIVGTMGWKATYRASRELQSMRRDIATGKAPNDLLDHLENTIGGVGSEYVSRLDFNVKDDWVRNKGDTEWNRLLDKLDAGLKKGAKGVLDYTGMTGVMVQQKRMHAVALTNHFVNVANGADKGFFNASRLAWMGMSEADHAGLNAAIKHYSKTGGKGQYGKKVEFDFKAFAKEKPQENAMLMNALHRETRRVIQENDLASMVPLMGTTLGKTVFQFMNFTMHAWNKSMLFSMNHKDFSTLSSVLHGSMVASLAYMGRTQLSSLGMEEDKKQEFLEKRMATGQIVANSFGKISQASLLPQLYDSTLGQTFTGPLFSGSRTTSDISSIASNPTLQAINGMLSMGKMVRNGISGEDQTTAKDIKAWAKLVPLNNVAPISTLFNSIANDYPSSAKQD